MIKENENKGIGGNETRKNIELEEDVPKWDGGIEATFQFSFFQLVERREERIKEW